LWQEVTWIGLTSQPDKAAMQLIASCSSSAMGALGW